MARYIKYRITTLEPIKIGNNQTRQNYNHETLRYISGSALRGAFIARFISRYGEAELDHALNLRFANAYIVADGKRTIPVCASLFASKDEREKSQYKIRNVFNEPLGERDASVGGGFGIYDGEIITGIPVETGQNLHISTRTIPDDPDEETKRLFQYEYISKGQQFDGFVVIDDSALFDKVINLLRSENNLYYIGGSKGSGYGQCRISDVCDQDIEYAFDTQCPDGYFYLLFLSDAIVRDAYGNLLGEVPLEIIKKNTGLEEVERVGMAVRLVNIGGYNQKMRSTLQQYTSIGAGSIYKYHCNDVINPELLQQWIDRGIGERRQDGYGRFTLMDELNFAMYKKGQPNFATETTSDISDTDGLELILKRIYENKLKTALKEAMATLAAKFTSPEKQMKAKIGNMMSHLHSIYNLQPREGRRQTENFCNNILEKAKKNPKGLGFYTLAQLNGVHPLDFIKHCIDNSEQGFIRSKGAELIGTDAVDYLNENDIYLIGIDFAVEVFKLILVKGESIA